MGHETGRIGENYAKEFLRKRGCEILELNYCNTNGRRIGEIDIIAKCDDHIVFVEVKTRICSGHSAINPEENITRKKLYKLNKISTYYIKKNNLWDTPYRFDALSIFLDTNHCLLNIKHLKNIFL